MNPQIMVIVVHTPNHLLRARSWNRRRIQGTCFSASQRHRCQWLLWRQKQTHLCCHRPSYAEMLWSRQQIWYNVGCVDHQLNKMNDHYWRRGDATQITQFMGPTWSPPGSCRPQTGPMLTPWTFLPGKQCPAEYVPVSVPEWWINKRKACTTKW